MTERRQAHRREPIEAEVRGKVFVAEPLPWMTSGDLGSEIIKQNADATNNAVRLYMDGDIPQLEMSLIRKISDWDALLKIAFPKNESKDWAGFDVDECALLALTAMEVNHLEYLNHLVDPNLPALTPNGGNESSEIPETGLGQKTESTPNSSSEASTETPS